MSTKDDHAAGLRAAFPAATTLAKEESSSTGATPGSEALELVHHHPGRLRVRASVFALAQGGVDVARRARERVFGIPGVTRFEHNARTGSLLVEYQPGLAEADAILEQVADAAGIAPCSEGAIARARTPAILAVGAVQELNAIVSELTGRKADLRSLIPAGLAALGAYTFAVGKEPRLPRWDNLLWWSYSVFVAHHGEEMARVAEARRERDPENHSRQGAARGAVSSPDEDEALRPRAPADTPPPAT